MQRVSYYEKINDHRLSSSVRLIVRIFYEAVSMILLNVYLVLAYKTLSSFQPASKHLCDYAHETSFQEASKV